MSAIETMHADWRATREAAQSIKDPRADLALLLAEVAKIEARISALQWAFEYSGLAMDDAGAAARELEAFLGKALAEVDHTPNAIERRFDAICAANDLREPEDKYRV